MRLIDADAFKEYICNAYERVKHMYPDGGEWARQITEDFCKDIDEQPTIDISNNSNTLGALDCVERQAAIDAMEKIDRVFKDLGLSCAYDMPGFWCHDGKDYKVIPTKYHKGYQQALSDAEKRIKLILKELCYG